MLHFPRFYRWLLDQEYSWLRILLLGLVLRVGLLAIVADEPLVSDSLYYHEAAVNLAEHGQLDTYWPPGLPLYEAAWVWIAGKGEFWVRLAMMPWFLWLCYSFYGITYRLHSRVAANIGLLLLSFFPAMIHQSVEPLSYLPAATLLLAMLAQMQLYVEERKRGRLWRAGILIGLIILFRPSAAIFLIALPPLILLRRRKLLPGLTLALFAALVVGPWLWVASSAHDRFIPINDANSRNFYLGNNAWTPAYKTWYYGSHWTADPKLPAGFRAELQEIEAQPLGMQGRAFSRAAWRDIRARPGAFAWRTASRLRTLLAFDSFAGSRLQWSGHPLASLSRVVSGLDALFYSLLGLAFLIFWFSEARRELAGGSLAIISGFLVLYALPYCFSFSHPTYHLPMLPLMLLPASIWLRLCLERGGRLPKIPKRNVWKAALALSIFVGIQIEWIIQMLFIP
jgi:4-amino-4-deoxy-L-arabinose transferase-like glycosyltransferase